MIESGERHHVEAIGQGKFVQFLRDRRPYERILWTLKGEIDIGGRPSRPFCP